MVYKYLSGLVYIALFMVVSACQGQGDDMTATIATRSLLSSYECGRTNATPALTVLDSRDDLDRAVESMRLITGQTMDGRGKIAFDREMIVQIHMGQQSTGGYSLSLLENKAQLQDAWAVIPVQWKVPEKGMMLTQALTSPCLFVVLPGGEYQGIRVVDEQGQLRLEAALE